MVHGDEVVAALARDRGRALVAYAFLLTGNVGDAEDLVQDALVKTVLRTRSGLDLDTAEAYVRRAVLTTFVDGHRRGRRWLAALPSIGAAAQTATRDPAGTVSAQVDVRAALATLPRRERACVVLRYYDDLPLAEIATTLGLAVGTVKRYLFSATRRLEQHLGPLDKADDHLPETVTFEHDERSLL